MGKNFVKVLPIVGVVAVCTAVTFLVDHLVTRHLQEKQSRGINRIAIDTTTALQGSLDHHQDNLESMAMFLTLKQRDLSGENYVDQIEFWELAKAPLSRGNGMKAMCWAPLIPVSKISEFTSRGRLDDDKFEILKFNVGGQRIPASSRPSRNSPVTWSDT